MQLHVPPKVEALAKVFQPLEERSVVVIICGVGKSLPKPASAAIPYVGRILAVDSTVETRVFENR
jgi:hypothetical protein